MARQTNRKARRLRKRGRESRRISNKRRSAIRRSVKSKFVAGAGDLSSLRITRAQARKLLEQVAQVDDTHEHYNDLRRELTELVYNPEYQNPFFKTYAQHLKEAEQSHKNLYGTLEEYIDRMRQETVEDDEEYTNEYKIEDTSIYNDLLKKARKTADTYKNDLHNYAIALIRNWMESGEGPSLKE